jgi:phenylacetate-CoA ligase
MFTKIASLVSLPFLTSRRKSEQWFTSERLGRVRALRLRRILAKARRAPYYRGVFSALGARIPPDFRLGQLPLLDKRVLAQHGLDAFLTRGRHGLLSVTTSGSTGEPAVFLRSPLEEAEFSARWWRVYASYGATTRDTLLNVGRANVKPRTGPVSLMRNLGILPKIANVSVATPVGEAARVVLDFEPRFITGFAVGVESIAEHMVNHGLRMRPPKAVICGAMDVTERCRALVRQAFGAPAVNVYASNEFGVIAWECPKRAGVLHTNDDMLVLEIVGADGLPVAEGESGNVVLTSLTLTSMPLIRYQTGDIAAHIPGRCECGRGLGLMTPVQGRTSHSITGPGGQLITAPLLANAFGACGSYEWVRRFQVHEAEDRLLRVLIEPKRPPHDAETRALISQLARTVGEVFTLELELRKELPLAPTGKFQFVVPLADRSRGP